MEILQSDLHEKFHLLPIAPGEKHPDFKLLNGKGWKQFQNEKIPENLIQRAKRVGIITGVDELEVIDVDNHFNNADDLLQFIDDNFDLQANGFPVVKTQSGGYHIFYYCSDGIEGNQKLAERLNDAGKYEALVETRGKGGYVVFYDNVIQGNILQPPNISSQQRKDLLEVCRALDKRAPAEAAKKATIPSNGNGKSNDRPGDSYTWQDAKAILQANGWQELNPGYWRRPGKQKGVSATLGKTESRNTFYVFSSNADPLQPNESYTPFGIFAELEHSGDYSAAAKALKKDASPAKAKAKQPEAAKKKNSEQHLSKKWRGLIDWLKKNELQVRYNTLSNSLEYKRKKETDWQQSIHALRSDAVFALENEYDVSSISGTKVEEMLMSSKVSEHYNPLNAWIEGLPKWNGKENIKALAKYIKITSDEDADFFANMLTKHLVRTLRGALEENYTNRIVLVLHGQQEIGKSKFFQWLMPDKSLYYDESINLNDKDSYLALSRYVIINLDELDQLDKKDVNRLKAFISKGDVKKRLPYGKTDTRFPRIASFVGSTNETDILADNNNTRWLILKTRDFDWKGYTANINPSQVWAEALHYYKQDAEAGELTALEKQERDTRNNDKFLGVSMEREMILQYLEQSDKPNMTATQAMNYLQERTRTNLSIKRVGMELKRLHGEPVRRKNGKFYKVKERHDGNENMPY